MRELGAGRIEGWIGPHVCGRCYEVPEQLRADVAAVVPDSYAETSWGTPSLDLGAGVRAQLEELDVAVHDVSRCTRESDDLYSYRRDGERAGRLAAVVRLRGEHSMSRRDEIEAGLDAVHRPHRRRLRRRRPGARRRPAGRGHQVLPGQRRPDPRRARRHRRRREPPPGGRGQGRRVRRPRPAVALHRRPAEQQGGRGRVVRRGGRVRRPAQAGRPALARGPPAVAPGRRAAPGLARPAGARAVAPGPTPPSSTSWRPRSTRQACSRCAA